MSYILRNNFSVAKRIIFRQLHSSGSNICYSAAVGVRNTNYSPSYLEYKNYPNVILESKRLMSTSNRKIIPMKLADIGEGIAEVEIRKWHVKEGDMVKEFDPLCDAKSDKASVTISARYAGRIKKLNYQVNDIVKVGSNLIEIETDSPIDNVVSSTANEGTKEMREPASAVDKSTIPQGSPKILASPSVRNFAMQNKVKIEDIQPSNGKKFITKEDVQQVIDQRLNAPKVEAPKVVAPKETENQGDEVVVLKGYYRGMFKTMTESLKIPHTIFSEDADVTKTMSELKLYKKLATERSLPNITLLSYVVKCVSLALAEYPKLNSMVRPESESNPSILIKKSHNIGIAVDTSSGLVVPVIHEVQKKSIVEIAKEIENLIELAKQEKLSEKDLKNGTFTISNIGSIAGSRFSPIILSPQVSLLAMGRVKKAIVTETSLEAQYLPLSCAADHRVIDGATLARFMLSLMEKLNSPIILASSLK